MCHWSILQFHGSSLSLSLSLSLWHPCSLLFVAVVFSSVCLVWQFFSPSQTSLLGAFSPRATANQPVQNTAASQTVAAVEVKMLARAEVEHSIWYIYIYRRALRSLSNIRGGGESSDTAAKLWENIKYCSFYCCEWWNGVIERQTPSITVYALGSHSHAAGIKEKSFWRECQIKSCLYVLLSAFFKWKKKKVQDVKS